jgi:hypothetical protein
MFNQLARRLPTAIVISVVLLATLIIGPLNAKLVEQDSQYSYDPPAICTDKGIRCKKESNGTIVLLPLSYDEKKPHPALIILPATDKTPAEYIADDFAQQYTTRTENSFIVLLLPVKGEEKDWKPSENFGRTKERYEREVKSNLDLLKPKYNINSVVVAGSSLGGDLSWSLSLRNPDLFQGTIIINSMSRERIPSSMVKLASNKSRFVLISSEVDPKKRLSCMRSAVKELSSNGIAYWFGVVPGAFSYDSLRTNMLMPSIDYVLFGKNLDGRSWDKMKPDDNPNNTEQKPSACP